MNDLALKLKDPGTFYTTKVSPGVWNVGVQGWKQNISKLKNTVILFVGLDYDSGQKIYTLQFDLIDAQDRFGYQKTLPGTLLVSVNDLPDKPPLWTSRCFFNTFEEEMPGDLNTDDLWNSNFF